MGNETQSKGAAAAAAPATLEEALVVIKSLTTENKDLAKQLEQSQKANAGQLVTITKSTENLEKLGKAMDQSKTVIADLKQKLKDAKKAAEKAANILTVEVDGKVYRVNHGAFGIGEADEIAADPALAAKILAKKGQNCLTPFE
jgi:predicted RNase H-like nuclease (RuvC/YqgF family)